MTAITITLTSQTPSMFDNRDEVTRAITVVRSLGFCMAQVSYAPQMRDSYRRRAIGWLWGQWERPLMRFR